MFIYNYYFKIVFKLKNLKNVLFNIKTKLFLNFKKHKIIQNSIQKFSNTAPTIF
jgi:hypothetical protein